MATFKKKDFKSYKSKKENFKSSPDITQEDKDKLKELVDSDGSPISGDHTRTNDSEIETGPVGVSGIPQTTDDYAATAIQPRNWWSLYGNNPYGGSNYSHGRLPMGESELKELATDKIRKMVEDIMSKKNDNRDMVKKEKYSDVNRNNIPDIDDLSDNNKQIVSSKTKELVNTIKGNSLSGDEIGIVLNFILDNVNVNELSNDYKRMIIKKL